VIWWALPDHLSCRRHCQTPSLPLPSSVPREVYQTMATRRCVLPAAALAALLLLYGVTGQEYGDYAGEDGGEDYGGEGMGGDYGDYGEDYGGMGGGGDPDSPAEPIKGVLDLDDLTFSKVVDGSRPAFVEFYAPWCGHCKEFKGELTALAEDMGAHPELLLVKVDAEANTELASRFGVEGFPTLMFLGKGALDTPEDYQGERTAEALRDFLTDRVGDVGQLAALAEPVARFLAATQSFQQADILKEVEAAVGAMSPMEQSYGRWYIKTMTNLKNKGGSYLEAEFKRLMKMVYDQRDSLKADKLSEFRTRLAVLKAFDAEGALKQLEAAKKAELAAAAAEEAEEGREEL